MIRTVYLTIAKFFGFVFAILKLPHNKDFTSCYYS